MILLLLFNGLLTHCLAATYSAPIDCLNTNVNVNDYITKHPIPQDQNIELHREDPKTQESAPWTPPNAAGDKLSVKAHSWLRQYGNGRNCMDITQDELENPRSLDHEGCGPFSNVIGKFKKLEQCVFTNINSLEGKWSVKFQERFEKGVLMTLFDRLMTRLVMLSEKAVADYLSDPVLLHQIFSSEQLDQGLGEKLRVCVTSSDLKPKQVQCWPVLFTAPGFRFTSVVEESRSSFGKQRVTDSCSVSPVCGRLAMQKLHHLTLMRFDSSFKTGTMKVIKLSLNKNWKRLSDSSEYHDHCQVPASDIGETICTHLPKCFSHMLKLVCKEHEACCPSKQVYKSCKRTVTDKNCEICTRDDPWYRLGLF